MRLRSLFISSSANLRAGIVHLLGNYSSSTIACDTAPHQAAPAGSSVSAIMNPQACDAPALKPANHRRFLISTGIVCRSNRQWIA
jgi:hypothetical protein